MRTTVSDPDGDQVVLEGYAIPPMYPANVSAFLESDSLVVMYTPSLIGYNLCSLACKGEALEDNFSLLLRDGCGATTEVPVTVVINVKKAPPRIIKPAQTRVVECNGQGNVEEYEEWLENHGGAVAEDICGEVIWSYKATYEAGCGNTGRYHVTFIATDCAGNSSSTSAEFVIVDTVPPHWDQPMPEDMVVECQAVPPVPLVTASDTCAGQVPVEFHEERIDGPCPYTYTLVRTWTATDGCYTITHPQRITVRDTTPPVLSVPADVDLGCNPPDTSPDTTGWATGVDNCDPSPQVSYTDSVSTVGCRVTIERTWRATDACGNTAEKVQRITYIQDTTPPVIHCPSTVTAYVYGCLAPDGTWVSFPITATDNCDPSPQLSCSSWGGWFPVGTTPVTVKCTATDRCGNSTAQVCTFDVTVVKANNPPVARSDSADCNGFCCVPVLSNDYDPDGDPITLVDASARCGSAWVSGNMVCYTTAGWSCGQPPGPGVTDSITYTITDGCSYATGTVYITITCTICPLSLPPEGGEP